MVSFNINYNAKEIGNTRMSDSWNKHEWYIVRINRFAVQKKFTIKNTSLPPSVMSKKNDVLKTTSYGLFKVYRYENFYLKLMM